MTAPASTSATTAHTNAATIIAINSRPARPGPPAGSPAAGPPPGPSGDSSAIPPTEANPHAASRVAAGSRTPPGNDG
ncbi:MAG: hypothetical protein GEV11_12245 [Streptosporangiales bacterium]|nr:hypothetical protein [Streptosporangiales bacterium]